MRYTFMQKHIEQYSMAALCEALWVSRSGYFAWKKRPQERKALDQAVAHCHQAHLGRAGAPCLTRDVWAAGLKVSERTVGRSLSRQGLRAQLPRKFKHTTDSNHQEPISPNLLDRQFKVDRPNQVWVSDITYIQTQEGWLYLATMIDLFNRQVVGWQMSTRIDQTLVNDALKAALMSRGKPRGVMIHTDRGSQYCSKSFRALIKQHGLVQSMSRKGNCWDNAVAESFFATLKRHCVHGQPLKTRAQMRLVVFEFIEVYYNRVRRHSANGWQTPVEFERLYHQTMERSTVH
jgi:putative transposase